MQIRLAALTALCASAFAQTPDQVRTFSFANGQTPQQMQEVVNTIRSVVELRNVAADPAQRTVTVGGNAEQLTFTAWLFTDLDKPAGAPANLVVRENSFPDSRAPSVRIYYPAHIATPQQLQELVNGIRSIAELQRVVVVNGVNAIIARGAPEQVALADWIVRELDQPATGSGVIHKQEYADTLPPERRSPAVRIYFPATISSPQEMQEAVNALRSIADVQRVVAFSSARAILFRGSDDRAALGDWLMKEFDQVAPSAGTHEQRVPEGSVRFIVLPKGADLAGTVARVRQISGIQRAVAYQRNRAVVLRGTNEQLAAADSVLR